MAMTRYSLLCNCASYHLTPQGRELSVCNCCSQDVAGIIHTSSETSAKSDAVLQTYTSCFLHLLALCFILADRALSCHVYLFPRSFQLERVLWITIRSRTVGERKSSNATTDVAGTIGIS